MEVVMIPLDDFKEWLEKKLNSNIREIEFKVKYAHLPDLLPMRTAAQLLGCTNKTITAMVNRNELKAAWRKTCFKEIQKDSVLSILWQAQQMEIKESSRKLKIS